MMNLRLEDLQFDDRQTCIHTVAKKRFALFIKPLWPYKYFWTITETDNQFLV